MKNSMLESPDEQLMKMMGILPNSKIVWVTEFDNQSTVRFYEKFMELEKDNDMPIVPVFITSYGGDLHSLIAMRDLIKSSSKPVATVGVGLAASCGASLLAAGSKGYRFAGPDTAILIHEASGIAPGKTSDIKEYARVMELLTSMMFKNLASDTGTPVEVFQKEIRKRNNVDWTLRSREAKRFGLIDHITIPRILSGQQPSFLGNTMPYDQMMKESQEQSKGRKS